MLEDDLIGSEGALALSGHGAFSEKFDGFNPRLAQQEMAVHVERAIKGKSVLVAESGTGTGKTFSYLVPSLQSGGRVIVSTGTRHLQDQLYHKDLPAVQKVLGIPSRAERLKGRANYLCLHRLDQSEGLLFADKDDIQNLLKVRKWSIETLSGDVSEAPDIADDAKIWSNLTTSADNCLGSKCDYIQDCFVYKARRRAMSADILIVNHHLFFSDIALKDEGFGEVLPEYDCVIFDEAHLIPEIASQFFGFGFGSSQVRTLCREIPVAESADKSGADFGTALIDVERACNEFILSVGANKRGELVELSQLPDFIAARDHLLAHLDGLAGVLDNAALSGDNLALAHQRCVTLVQTLKLFGHASDSEMVFWYETGKRSLRLQATPVSVAGRLKERLFCEPVSMVFTSATLCTEGSGLHFRQAMGLESPEVAIWESPYNFAERALLYVPDNMPEPANARFAEAMLERILPVLRASRGRAFVLFTSYRMMHEVHELLSVLDEFPLLLQGETSKQRLIEKFRDIDGSVLFGTSSFWEGVDVKGDDLICVIIDKLPFPSPFDPVNRARLRHIEDQGGNSFSDYLLPKAVIALKQGAGRLIRDELDYGVLMICDQRIVDRGYGHAFIDALPPMRRTRKESLVVRFLNHFDEHVKSS